MSAAEAKKARPASPGWLKGLGCGVLIAASPATALLGAVLLSPSLLMRVMDREHDRAASRAVLLSNLAGAVGAVAALWRNGMPTVAGALDLLGEPPTILIAWAAAAAGWLGSEFAAQAALGWLTAKARREMRAARTSADSLVTEWGEPPPALPARRDGQEDDMKRAPGRQPDAL